MSFKSVFSKIVTVGDQIGKVEVAIAPMVAPFSPQAAAFLSITGNSILKMENAFQEPKSGPQKKLAVMSEVGGLLSMLFVLQGKPQPEGLTDKLSSTIDHIVQAMNGIKDIQEIVTKV